MGMYIPKQTGASDSATPVHAWLERHQFLPWGWIHTHPQHSAFMSSVDLHSQFALQVSVRSSLALVLSYLDNEEGDLKTYRLTFQVWMSFIRAKKLAFMNTGARRRRTCMKRCAITSQPVGRQQEALYEIASEMNHSKN